MENKDEERKKEQEGKRKEKSRADKMNRIIKKEMPAYYLETELELKRALRRMLRGALILSADNTAIMNAISKIVIASITSRLDSILGIGFTSRLLEILRGVSVREYRFCGGYFMNLFRKTNVIYRGDVDLFVVPNDENLFCRLIKDISSDDVVISYQDSAQKPGEIHNMKIMRFGEVIVDIVLRLEVNTCAWIDVPACRSGIYGRSAEQYLELYDISNLSEDKVVVDRSVSIERCSKLARKGFSLLLTQD